MHAVSDTAISQRSLAAPSIATYRAGETVLSAASTSGRLLILKEGAVSVDKEGGDIAKVSDAGTMFGELSAWRGEPHTADVHAMEELKFHVVSTAALRMQEPVALSFPAAERPKGRANPAPVEMKPEVQDGQLSCITRKAIDKIEESLAGSGGNLIYAGYPYDPFVLDTVEK